MITPLTRPVRNPEIGEEPPYVVIIHNDDVTTFDFVISILVVVFNLTEELADHIAWQAHHKGLAPVVTRPRSEALALVEKAHALAQANGFPLTFSVEPQD